MRAIVVLFPLAFAPAPVETAFAIMEYAVIRGAAPLRLRGSDLLRLYIPHCRRVDLRLRPRPQLPALIEYPVDVTSRYHPGTPRIYSLRI